MTPIRLFIAMISVVGLVKPVLIVAQNESVNMNEGAAIDVFGGDMSDFSAPDASSFDFSNEESLLTPQESDIEQQSVLETFLKPSEESVRETQLEESLIDPSDALHLESERLEEIEKLQDEKQAGKSLIDPLEGKLILAVFLKPEEVKKIGPNEAIVESVEKISDFEARLTLVKWIVSAQEENLDEAIGHLQLLLQEKPQLPLLHLELGKIYLKQERFELANQEFETTLHLGPLSADLMLELAEEETKLGHIKLAQTLFEEALAKSQQPKKALLQYASMMLFWGDFYRAENIFRDAICEHPASQELYFKLAATFIAAQRYEEAEQIYQLLYLQDQKNTDALYDLGRLKLLEKDFVTAQSILDQLFKLCDPKKQDKYLEFQADLFFKQAEYTMAANFYRQALDLKKKPSAELLVKLSRTLLKDGQREEAIDLLQQARHLRPFDIEVAFYLTEAEERNSLCFVDQLIASHQSAQALSKWADLYVENGSAEPAVLLYREAVKIDPNHFPARLKLALLLPLSFQYQESLEIYEELLQEFPCNPRLLLERARVLSWSKAYRSSIEAYDELISINPKNPVPIREKARVAFWGKKGDLGRQTFESLLVPAVDQLLLDDLAEISLCTLGDWQTQVMAAGYENTLYQRYEAVREMIADENCQYHQEDVYQLRLILTKHLATYRIQKSISIESTAKWLIWNKRFRDALPVFEELIDFSPGNEEALFDYAQNLQTVGLCGQAPDVYRTLIQLTPLHNIAQMALDRSILYNQPSILGTYSYWYEVGRGELSNTARHRWKLGVDHPITCQTHVLYFQNRWLEHPLFVDRFYYANGPSFELNHYFSTSLRGSASFAQKVYENTQLNTHYLGYLRLWYQPDDWLYLGAGFERDEELPNYFAIIQEIQTNTIWAGCKMDLSRKFHIEELFRSVTYSDRNHLTHILLDLSYQLAEYPDIIKLILNGEYRDTEKRDVFIFDTQGQLINIIHPYWTPQNYFAWRVNLEFKHDYAFLDFNESEKKFFRINVMTGNDTDHNRAGAILFEWRHDFRERWSFELQALIHRSREWDADGVWLSLRYRI